MWDFYKNCDPRDDDNWSFAMLACWVLVIVTGLTVTLAFCGAHF